MPPSSLERARAARWFRGALAMTGQGGTPSPLPEVALDAADAGLFADARTSLEAVPSDFFRAALLASEAGRRCRQARWDELASLLDVVRHLAVLPAAERVSDLIDPASSPDQSVILLQEMLSERPPPSDSGTDLLMLPLFVFGRRDRTVPGPRKPVVTWQRLDEHLGHLDALAGLAAAEGLIALHAHALELQLDILAQLVAAAGREAAWEHVATYRARYRARWRPGRRVGELPAAVAGRQEKLGRLFENLAKMHDLGLRHGSLLLENVGPGGELKSFAHTEFRDQDIQNMLDSETEAMAAGRAWDPDFAGRLQARPWEPASAADLEWLAEDLVPLRYQLDQEEWESGRTSYLRAASSSKAAQVLEMVEALAPQEKVDGAHDHLPSRDVREPDIRIRIAGLLLRYDPTASVDFAAGLEAARSISDQSRRISTLLEVAAETDRLDWRIQDGAVLAVLEALAELADRHDPAVMADSCDAVTTTAASIGHQPLLLVATALADLSRALSAAPPAQRAAPEGGTDAARANGQEPEPILAAISTLESTGVRAWQAPITHILEAWGWQDAPDQIRASAETGGYQSADQATTTGGLAADVDSPRDGPRDDGDLSGSADDPAQAAPTQPAAELGPSPEARAAIRNRDWGRAASQLRIDLDDLEWRTPQDRASRNTAALLASVLTSCLEFFPQHRERLGAEILDLAARYGAQLLEDVRAGRSGDSGPAAHASRAAASNLGYAMTSVFTAETGDTAAVDLSIQLLREAAERTDAAAAPEVYAIRANNLALGYRLLARVTTEDQRLENLTRAEAILVDVARIDEEAFLSGNGTDSRYIDYANLGDVRADLASHTYDATWISQKATESARWYRGALDAYFRSADIAEELGVPENLAHAYVRAAAVYLELCNHYALERYYAGGDLHAAFYDWLRAFAGGGHVRTDRLVASWAASALSCVSEAAQNSIPRNPSLVIECIEAAVRLWSLSQWRSAVPPELGRHALAMIVEVTGELEDSGMLRMFPEELGSLAELQAYWAAMLSFEAYRIDASGEAQIRSAWRQLEHLSRAGSSVVRALAWPQRLALEFDRGEHGVVVNGLLIETDSGGTSLGIPSLRRTVRLEGIMLEGVGIQIRDQPYVRAASAAALRHLTPMLAWDDLPPDLLAGYGQGLVDGNSVVLQTLRIPTSGWDSWLVWLGSDGADALEIGLSLPYLGRYDQVTGVLDTQSPGVLRRDTEVLVFGEQGITLEITAPQLDGDDEPDSQQDTRAELTGDDRAAPTVRSHVRDLHFLLKASPRIAFSDAVSVVRDDGSSGAAVCAASFVNAAPSIAFPASAMHSFAPLLFFRDRLDSKAFGWLNEIRPRAVVVVGAPENVEDAVTLLLDLFDPRRDLLWLVDGQEAEVAQQAVAEARSRILETPGAQYLLRSASSATDAYDISVNFQLAVVPRELAPAAAQMLLDLSTVRHRDAENILVVADGKPMYLNMVGNPLAALWRATLFDEPATWDALADRYRSLTRESAAGKLVMDSGAITKEIYEALLPKVPRRPVVLFDPSSTPAVASIPHARLLGALFLPFGETSFDLMRQLEPDEVYAPEHAVTAVPQGNWTTIPMPDDPREIARGFQVRVREDHARQLERLAQTHPHLVASKALLEEMQPAKYVVLSSADPGERAFGYLAANYAASMQAPLYLMAEAAGALSQGQTHEIRTQAESLMTGRALAARGMSRSTRDLLTHEAAEMPDHLGELFQTTCADLDALAPDYVSLVSSFAAFPIELIGTPPLATRFAIGRLIGPDLPGTALLVARAALSEDVSRPADIRAVLADCADAVPGKIVPEARAEILAVDAHLAGQPHVRTMVIDGPSDLSRFLQETGEANIVHFAGHCWFDPDRPGECGLIFREGVLTSAGFSAVLDGLPVVFSNACETGLLSPAQGTEGVLWTGVAASFLAGGAVNYLGSMWPVFDDGSRRIAQFFYERLCAGEPIGEALRQARLDAYERNDPTWAAYVLFGCPRNRLRPPASS